MTSSRTVEDEAFSKALADLERWRKTDHKAIEYLGFLEDAPSVVEWDGDAESFIGLINNLTPAFAYIDVDELDDDHIDALAEELLEHQAAGPGSAPEEDEDEDELGLDDGEGWPELEELAGSLKERLGAQGHKLGEPVELRLGFVRDGIFHSLAIEPAWYVGFVDGELAVVQQREDEARQRQANAFEELKQSGFFEGVLKDKRLFGAVSNNAVWDACAAIVLERSPELSPDGSVAWMRRSMAHVAPDLLRQVATKKSSLEAGALADLESFGADFFTTPAYKKASTMAERERLARAYVEEHLGFKSTAVTSKLARHKGR